MTRLFRRRRNNNNNPSPPSSGNNNVPIARAIPIGNHATPAAPAAASSATATAISIMTCHTCSQPITRNTRHIHTSRALSGERRYHRECFLCLHCNAPIDPQEQSFCYAKLLNSNRNNSRRRRSSSDNGSQQQQQEQEEEEEEEHPFHRECFAHHFGWMCVVCEKPLPMVTKFNEPPGSNSNATSESNTPEGSNHGTSSGTTGTTPSGGGGSKSTKVEFLKHPFFDKERMCPHHAGPIEDQVRRLGEQQQGSSNIFSSSAQQQQQQRGGGGRLSVNTTTTEETIGEIRRCAGCHRFEPLFASPTKHFIDVGDSNTGRCVCLACCRTVVTNSDDVIPLWDKVIDFFEGPLGLITSEDSVDYTTIKTEAAAATATTGGARGGSTTRRKQRTGVTRRDLKNIPIMVVGLEALNDNMKPKYDENGERSSRSSHFGSSQIMTRGLCLSEHSGGCDGGVGVTAVLCLSGLPADLTASILAHEATHAWIKLHPNFPYTDPLPLKVEEGLCQLVAFLFLNDGLDPIGEDGQRLSSLSAQYNNESFSSSAAVAAAASASSPAAAAATKQKEDDSIPSDEKLRQYFRFCIETDEGVYGEGFRLAARAYAKMGIQELLYYVAVHHDFPPL